MRSFRALRLSTTESLVMPIELSLLAGFTMAGSGKFSSNASSASYR